MRGDSAAVRVIGSGLAAIVMRRAAMKNARIDTVHAARSKEIR
jgi:hypothetical protein